MHGLGITWRRPGHYQSSIETVGVDGRSLVCPGPIEARRRADGTYDIQENGVPVTDPATRAKVEEGIAHLGPALDRLGFRK